MTPQVPGSGPGFNAQRMIDVKQIDRIVLAAIGLRNADRDPTLQQQVSLFQGSGDGRIKSMKVNLAEDIFGRLAYDSVTAAINSQSNTMNILIALGSELNAFFGPHSPDPVEIRSARVMARLAKRKFKILSQGSDTEEREDEVAFKVLKRWVDGNKDARFAYLDGKVRQSYVVGNVAARPWLQQMAPQAKGSAPEAIASTNNPLAALIPLPVTPNLTGSPMTNQPEPANPAPPGDPAGTPEVLPTAPIPPLAGTRETSDTSQDLLAAPTPATSAEAAHVAAPVGPVAPAKPRASAWKFLEVPEEEPDRHTYTQALDSYHKTPTGLPIVAARVRGKKHKHEGTNGDDAYDIGFAGNWTILAVSDGAGSCRFSRVGSQASCDAAVDVLARRLMDVPLTLLDEDDIKRDPVTYKFVNGQLNQASEALHEAMQAAYKAIENETQKRLTAEYDKVLGRHIEVKDLSCTLLLAIHIPVVCQGKKYDWVMGCQVGDGMIAAVSEAGSLVMLATADTGAFSGETDFITSKNKLEPAVLWSKTQAGLINMRALIAMTDGVADDYFPNNPGILRLFGDLCLNGAAPFTGIDETGTQQTRLPLESISTISERLTGEQLSEEVRIYSVEAYAKAIGKSVEQVMKEPHERLARNVGINNTRESASQRLLVWLDSYQVRGSFDDRALAMIYSTEASKEVQ